MLLVYTINTYHASVGINSTDVYLVPVPRTAVWCVTGTGTAVLCIKSLSTTKRVPLHSALLCTYTAVQQSSVASSSRRGVIASSMRGEAQQKSSLPVACITIYWYLPVVVLTKL